MNASDPFNPQNDSLNKVLEIIHEIAEKSAYGDCIYRGEPECYKKVSSSLYREYGVESEHFDIEAVQREILKEAESIFTKTTNLKSDPTSTLWRLNQLDRLHHRLSRGPFLRLRRLPRQERQNYLMKGKPDTSVRNTWTIRLRN